MFTWRNPGSLTLLAMGGLFAGGCGSEPRCSTDCPRVAGAWNLITTYFSVTGSCAWFNSTGSSPMTIAQPNGGSQVEVTVEITDLVGGSFPYESSVVLNGSIDVNDDLTATAPLTLYSDGVSNDQRTDSLSFRFSDPSDFSGSWSSTLEETDCNNQPIFCSRDATVNGTRCN
jgi:hypothetical protein